MKKRLQFFIALLLICVLTVGGFALPASSFTNEVETSTNNIILVNLDTHTTVYSQKSENMWYQGDLADLMTFLIAYEKIEKPEEVEFKVEKSFIDSLPYSDGCLNQYLDVTLKAQDLMAIMLLTSGSDAAYALANIVSDGDYDAFVKMMDSKAKELGCTGTTYMSPGYSKHEHHHTTCSDLVKIYLKVLENEFYNKVVGGYSYTPKGLKGEKYTVTSEASILNSKSPYYFKYCNDAKFSYSKATNACIALTTTYRGHTYFFAGLYGKNESEKNVYADAKKLTSWAYTNLSDRKAIDSDKPLASVKVDAGWGDYQMDLVSLTSAYKTLPNDFEEDMLSYSIDAPDTVKWPLFNGQKIGTANLTYDSEEIDKADLVLTSNEGVSLLSDTARLGSYVFDLLMPPVESEDTQDGGTEAPAQSDTQPATEKPKSTAPAATEG